MLQQLRDAEQESTQQLTINVQRKRRWRPTTIEQGLRDAETELRTHELAAESNEVAAEEQMLATSAALALRTASKI